jgi:hypothetical protein
VVVVAEDTLLAKHEAMKAVDVPDDMESQSRELAVGKSVSARLQNDKSSE